MSLYAFLHITKPSLAFSFTVWLPPTGSRRAYTETVYSVERETGLEPATACLEGRNSTTELLPHALTKTGKLLLRVGVRGLEPRTSWSQTMRATNCATPR